MGERKKKGATTQLSAIYRNPRCAAESLATFKRGYRRHHSHAATIVSLIFYVLSASGICGGICGNRGLFGNCRSKNSMSEK